jgi:small subunit ribosomal protein S1
MLDQARWTGGEKLDCAIAELDLDKRKATLSIKLLKKLRKKKL